MVTVLFDCMNSFACRGLESFMIISAWIWNVSFGSWATESGVKVNSTSSCCWNGVIISTTCSATVKSASPAKNDFMFHNTIAWLVNNYRLEVRTIKSIANLLAVKGIALIPNRAISGISGVPLIFARKTTEVETSLSPRLTSVLSNPWTVAMEIIPNHVSDTINVSYTCCVLS